MKIKISALDLLFFGDSKPFVTGEDRRSQSLSVPNLSTLCGALRTAYFAGHRDQFKYANEPEDPTAHLVITDFHLMINFEAYYPVPADLVHIKDSPEDDSGNYQLYPLKSVSREGLISSSEKIGLEEIFVPAFEDQERADKVENLSNAYFSETELRNYLEGFEGPYSAIRLDEMIGDESKFGIKRLDNSHAVEEGYLYQLSQKRYGDVSFILEFEGLELPDKGLIKVGGQTGGAYYTKVEEDSVAKEPVDNNGSHAKIYLTTPAIFKEGWIPDTVAQDTLTGEMDGAGVKLVSACVSGNVVVGGYDVKNHCQKPLKLAVPAGTVYRFKLTDHQDNIKTGKTQIDGLNTSQGFGLGFLIKEA